MVLINNIAAGTKRFVVSSSNKPLPDLRGFIQAVHNIASSIPLLRRGRDGVGASLDFDEDDRQFYRECGWPQEPSLDQYLKLIRRNPLADRAAHVYADESWAAFPEVYESEDGRVQTPFEKALEKQNPLNRLWTYCHLADRASCEGRMGGLYLGMSDGREAKDLAKPVAGFMPRRGRPMGIRPQLNYLTPMHQGEIEVLEVEGRYDSPRFNQPTYYHVRFDGYEPDDMEGSTPAQPNQSPVKVHWSRVIHLCPTAPGRAIGRYYLDTLLNPILDGQKVGGSSAEMFFKGGFPGLSFEAFKELIESADVDYDSIRDEAEQFMNGLKKYLASAGGTWKSLAPNIADPTPHMALQVMLITTALRCPVRIFVGSESGHLASTQDIINWTNRIMTRRSTYLNVFVVRQLIERLIGFGLLPRPKSYEVAWPDLNMRTGIDSAEEGLKKSQALMQYLTSKSWMLFRPMEYLTLVLHYTTKQAAMIVRKAGGEKAIIKAAQKMEEKANATTQGGGRNGNPPKRTPNRPADKILRKG